MSFVTAIRDYVDLISQTYDPTCNRETLLVLCHHTLLYLFGSIKYGLSYMLSLRWITDLLYLPILAPQMSLGILRENFYPLESPLENVVRLLETPSFIQDKFFVGFLNSLFVSLPTSSIHLLAGRRLLVEGIPAGMAAGLGTIVGQSCFLSAILFGWRWLIIPWLSVEPLNYVVGVLVLLQSIYTMCHASSIKIVPASERRTLLKFFLLNLLLTWCEQSSLFQYVGNLTMTSDPSYVENFFATSRLSSRETYGFSSHIFYLLGFFLGSCCFSLLFAWMAVALKEWWLGWSTMTTSRLINRLNFCFLVGVTALSFASIPYYGLDYLVTKGLGFVPQDKTFQETILSPGRMADTSKHIGVSSNYASLDTDATPFDGGRYLESSSPQTFEDLNYQGEQYWTGRVDRKIFTTGGRKGQAFGKWANLFGEKKKEIQRVADEKPIQKKGSMEREEERRSRGSSLNDPLPWYRESSESNILASFTDEETLASFLSDLEQVKKEDPSLLDELMRPPSEDTESESEEDKDDKVEQEDILFNDFFSIVDAGFSPLFLTDAPDPTNLEHYLKTKFYTNPLYHLLLRVDIDTFLARQPASHSLTREQEVDLFRRRQALADYYESIRDCMQLQRDEGVSDLEYLLSRYGEYVSNHQFKGTLKVVRRLFSMTLNPEENWEEERVLKFDQPLFHSVQGEVHPLLHEELSDQGIDCTPFIEMTSSRPFYAGWDEQLRRLVITTRYLPRSVSTDGMRIPDKEGSRHDFKEYFPLTRRLAPQTGKDSRWQSSKGEENPLFRSTGKILFTTWPIRRIPTRMVDSASNDAGTRSFVVARKGKKASNDAGMFASAVDEKVLERVDQFTHPDGEYHDWEIDSLPENIVMEWMERGVLPPRRGGLIWPGSSPFPVDLRKFLPDITKVFQ